jgi:hypothetical protein
MSFANTAIQLIGRKMCFEPHSGNTWMLCVPGKIVEDLKTPEKFNLILREVLIDCAEARVLVGQLHTLISGHEFIWGALIARSDNPVDLMNESVHCNLILSKSKPTISGDHPYPHPSFVSANAEPYVRGFGILSLLKSS